MTADEARDRFSAAYDGMLSDEEKQAFDARLASDEALRAEYAELVALLDDAHGLDDDAVVEAAGEGVRDLLDSSHELLAEGDGEDDEDPREGSGASVDLVAGVQARIRHRSRGRYYRDRFSQQSGSKAAMPLLLALVMLLVVGVAYFMVNWVHDVQDVEGTGGGHALPAQSP